MRKITLYSILFFSLALGSCKKFLEEYSQDEIRPGTTDELSSLMYSDAYPRQTVMDNFDLLTDDVMCNGPAKDGTGNFVSGYLTALEAGRPMFKYDVTMFDATSSIASGTDVYSICYGKIKGCNVVMDYLDGVKGTDKERNAIKGQCLFLRAYYYLRLVTAYAQPYTRTDIDPAKALGVPLVLTSKVKDGGVGRNTLEEVYGQIESDLLTAATLLNDNYTPATIFRVGNVAAWTLLSRLYLYKGNWDKVVEYSSKALEQNPNLTPFTSFINTSGVVANTGLYNIVNAEIIWAFGNSTVATTYFPSLYSQTPPYSVSSSLAQLYDQQTSTANFGDLRYKIFFSLSNGGPYYAAKYTANAVYGASGLRVAELYLNRAEALSKRFLSKGDAADRTQALADLNTLRASRYDNRNTAYANVDISDGNALFSFCQNERRRELCLEEGFRWVDIKRWGLSVTHVFTGTDGLAVTSTLAANSNLYALPIPYTAMNNNDQLVQNPR
ncbi:SusD family protein [Filimonas lacunae]|uniref:SusD family protein n=1 Tax=Filimonas lacunae TaxID=477680 RepID=A0A173MCY5_9BACT|nr:RagB/SusD family nutrient uptake outer membrane protein [Filimonas lacunae]BAV05377.1 outer membrane protein, nutrient binding [Filimonas lacunae]SIT21626.1 SusD family protein [Filimonas lacunae]